MKKQPIPNNLAASLSKLSSPSDERSIRDLFSQLFISPSKLIQTFSYELNNTVEFTPHKHSNQIQFDLFDNCVGEIYIEDKWHPITGSTAMVAYPGSMHGYKISPKNKHSYVYHIKIQTQKHWPVCKYKPWPEIIVDFGKKETLISTLKSVMNLSFFSKEKSIPLVLRLCESLYLWPRTDTYSTSILDIIATADQDSTDRRIIKSLELIERSPSLPPTQEELAQACHLSPRHFARRFRALLGCTPHEYATARRLQKASSMLLDDRLKIYQIAEALGFSSVGVFSRWFTSHTGQSPTNFRNHPNII
ncbi:helix-turn-helix domain-containing protein [Planctomycetota bacterium]|nr:helix-turn-helix domain-containing protein [Planctomycetota bacterium]